MLRTCSRRPPRTRGRRRLARREAQENNTELAVRRRAPTSSLRVTSKLEKQLERPQFHARVRRARRLSKAQASAVAMRSDEGEAATCGGGRFRGGDANERLRDASGIDDEKEPRDTPGARATTGRKPAPKICRECPIDRRDANVVRIRAVARKRSASHDTPRSSNGSRRR